MQAKLLAEVARGVAEPVEKLPPGSGSAVALGLYRDAVYWALRAARPDEDEPPADLGRLWEAAPRDWLLASLGDVTDLDAAKAVLVDGAQARSLDPDERDLNRARRCAEALVAELEAPRRRLGRLVMERWSRVALLVVLIGAAVLGGRRLAVGPNLAAGKTYRTSSAWTGCAADAHCSVLLFHTNDEQDPWAELDLGAPERFRHIEITNREDCCEDRAAPMVVEASLDAQSWTEIAKRDQEFSTWRIDLPPTTARYLRFKLHKHTALHLRDIVVTR